MATPEERAPKRQRTGREGFNSQWLISWFDCSAYSSIKTGAPCNWKQWELEGKNSAHEVKRMTRALNFLKSSRETNPEFGFHIMSEDTPSEDPNAGFKKYAVGSLDRFYRYLCEKPDARSRNAYAMVLESNGPIPLLIDVDSKCETGGRKEFIQLIKDIMAEVRRLAWEEARVAPESINFIVDDTFESTEVNGDPRCSAHVMSRDLAFETIEEARLFNHRLNEKFPGIDKNMPKARGLWKWVGNCKLTKRKRWQYPNPLLLEEAPSEFAEEKRESMPFAAIVSWPEFERRRPWFSDDELLLVKFWPTCSLPVSIKSQHSMSSTDDEVEIPRKARLPMSTTADTGVKACFDEILVRIMGAFGSEAANAKYYGDIRGSSSSDQIYSRCLEGYHRCSPTVVHKRNNMYVTLFMDSGTYLLRCLDQNCPHHKKAHDSCKGRLIFK